MADLKEYYDKVKQIEDVIAEPYTVVVSVPTSDGGKPGLKTEVTRKQAARLVADNKARLANEDEMEELRAEIRLRTEEDERRLRNESLRLALLTKSILKDYGLAEKEE